jgi:anthranilate phosphoribosyltransferase
MANSGWNFNVRNFNPGGNHGSFFRISTHSVFMLAGAGVPAGLRVEEPYDSLNFVPTLLELLGRPVDRYPGAPIREIVSGER